MTFSSRWSLFAIVLTVSACTPTWTGVTPETAVGSDAVARQNLRVVQSAGSIPVSFEELVTRAAAADVVVFGEQHDDAETHFAEFALLEEIGRRRERVVLSLEMFERDVQPVLDDFVAGRISEADFLERSRPWPQYVTDYRPLVLLAKARGWRVIAADVPRPIAAAVNRKGLTALDTLSGTSRAWAAAQIICPHDAYYGRVAAEAASHSSGMTMSAIDSAQVAAMTERFYLAQCIKDETMGESIIQARARAGEDAIVVHFNGAFHSDYRQGTAARIARRSPETRLLVITAVPSADPMHAPIADAVPRADYVIFTKSNGGIPR